MFRPADPASAGVDDCAPSLTHRQAALAPVLVASLAEARLSRAGGY
jgi:hypothetical protein